MDELRLYLPTFDLRTTEVDTPITLVWDGQLAAPCKQINLGYSTGGESYHDFFRQSPHLETKEELQAAGFKEITYYRDIGDSKLYGRYALIPDTRRKDNKTESGYILLGWLSMNTSHPLLLQFFSLYMRKEHHLYLADGTKIEAEFDYAHSHEGGDGIFWAWVPAQQGDAEAVEKLEGSQLRIELWDVTINQLSDTLIF